VRRGWHRAGYSLLEVVLVIAIMSMLMAMSLPTVQSTLRASRVDAGVSRVAQEVRLARQRAMTSGRFVAVLLPTAADDHEGGFTNPLYKASALRSCLLDGPPVPVTADGATWFMGTFASYVENTSWQFLPGGVFLGYTDTFGPAEVPAAGYNAHTCHVVSGVRFPEATDAVSVDNVRALIFRPNGSLLPNPVTQTHTGVLVQAGRIRNGTDLLMEGTNAVGFEINRFTGKVNFDFLSP
jgi:prepilin-type N-terminal cleavage/methylation domain-containing protein